MEHKFYLKSWCDGETPSFSNFKFEGYYTISDLLEEIWDELVDHNELDQLACSFLASEDYKKFETYDRDSDPDFDSTSLVFSAYEEMIFEKTKEGFIIDMKNEFDDKNEVSYKIDNINYLYKVID